MFALGLLEYLSPTISMFLGIFVYDEPFDRIILISFAIIWASLVFFTAGEYREHRLRA